MHDLRGQQFGRWTVLRRARSDLNRHGRWLCECACDAHTRRVVDEHNLGCGSSRSCGCLKREAMAGDAPDPPRTIFEALDLDRYRGPVTDTSTLAAHDFCPAEPPAATDAIPGTLAKVAVLAKRLEDGQDLFHAADPTCFDDASTAELPTDLPLAVPRRATARKSPSPLCTRSAPVEHTSAIEDVVSTVPVQERREPMSEVLKSLAPNHKEILRNLVAASTGQPVEKIGDGAILQWLIANGPSIMAFVMQIVALFGKPVTPTV
jgi:hypothetical protein